MLTVIRVLFNFYREPAFYWSEYTKDSDGTPVIVTTNSKTKEVKKTRVLII